jgi:hypothetical protein
MAHEKVYSSHRALRTAIGSYNDSVRAPESPLSPPRQAIGPGSVAPSSRMMQRHERTGEPISSNNPQPRDVPVGQLDHPTRGAPDRSGEHGQTASRWPGLEIG